MTRYHATPEGLVPYTPEEEIEADLAEQEWLNVGLPNFLAEEARSQRNSLLIGCDWTQVADSPLSNTLREQWAVYRQDLRNVPQQPGFPEEIVWPVPPGPNEE